MTEYKWNIEKCKICGQGLGFCFHPEEKEMTELEEVKIRVFKAFLARL